MNPMERLLGFILRPRSPRRNIWRVTMWAIATALGMFMIGRGAWTLLQPWGNAWFKLFSIGFCVCVTGVALYKAIASAAPPTSPLNSSSLEALIYSASSFLFVVAGVVVVLKKGATTGDVIAGACGILFFGVGGIVLFRRAREDWRRR